MIAARFSILAALVAAAQMVAAAPTSSAPPPPPAAQVNAAPPADKIVTRIQCSDYLVTKQLKVAQGDSDAQAASLSSDSPALLQTGGDSVKVLFTECKSNILDVNSSGNTHYGILATAENKDQCFAAPTLNKDNEQIQVVPCSFSDDSSQLVQFWKYDEKSGDITFVGRTGGGKPYNTGVQDKKVTVSANADGNATLSLD
ncbi:hypothetical protein MSPP1_003097 [Malassezia sp. CBS 17886]|nr:hypothetical protein MSPP1_003097 [Malassezia sp. CBS 17886]